jgi:hypothetical protein
MAASTLNYIKLNILEKKKKKGSKPLKICEGNY